MAKALWGFFEQEFVVIQKKTKRGIREINLLDGILRFSSQEQGNDVRVFARISAQEPTINPDLLAEALRQKAPELAPDFARFTRIETYDAGMRVFR